MAKPVRTKMSLKGDKQLQKLLKTLPKKARGVLKKAVNAGATPIVKTTRKLIQNDTGLALQSIIKKTKTYGNENAVAIIGASKDVSGTDGSGRRRIPSYYWHLILGGVKAHTIKTTSGSYQHPGFKGSDALQRANDLNEGKSKAIMEEKLKTGIEKEISKLS